VTTTPAAGGRTRSLPVRTKIMAVVATGVLAALAVGAVGVITTVKQRSAADQAARLAALQAQVAEIKYYDADLSGWQVAYAGDVVTLGPRKAVAPTTRTARASSSRPRGSRSCYPRWTPAR